MSTTSPSQRGLNAAAGSGLVSMDDNATRATRIRTDLGLTGDAADASLDCALAHQPAGEADAPSPAGSPPGQAP